MREPTLEVVREILARYTTQPRLLTAPPDEVSLQSLDIASADMIGIIIDLEDRFARVIDETRIHELQTVADLARALAEPCAK